MLIKNLIMMMNGSTVFSKKDKSGFTRTRVKILTLLSYNFMTLIGDQLINSVHPDPRACPGDKNSTPLLVIMSEL